MADSSGFRFIPQHSVDQPANSKRRNRKGLSLVVPATRPHSNLAEKTPHVAHVQKQVKPLDNQKQPPYKSGPICILPYLYLGDEHNANNTEHLHNLGIGYILNVAKEVDHPNQQDFASSDISDNEDDEGGATSPSLSISSSASSASSIDTLTSFSFGVGAAEYPSRRSSFRMNEHSPTRLTLPLDDYGENCPFSPRGPKPAPRGLKVVRFRPAAPSLSFTSAFRTTRQESTLNKTALKRYPKRLTRRLSSTHSAELSGRRKRHTLSEVAQADDGSQLHQIKYKKLPWTHNHENLAFELGPALDIIERARTSKRAILVHCQCGVARSASLVIAYVMQAFKISLNQAYDFVKTKSNSISPNMYLMFQLRDFETHRRLGLDHHKATATKRSLRKCNSMQFDTTTHYIQPSDDTKNQLISNFSKLEFSSKCAPSADPSNLMLTRRSLDDSFYHSYSFRSEPPFTNDLPMYL
ncbi:tyrosine/serine/threonine protein phosphatase [Umbelopsis sp. WA50703]